MDNKGQKPTKQLVGLWSIKSKTSKEVAKEVYGASMKWFRANVRKCESCGKPMKKSGPYAPDKKEGEPTHKGPLPVFYTCMNEKCNAFNKNKEVPDNLD
ncbi:MAG: hypothetical protein A3J67_03055 [Parcubacteria group bacterium RIFCSPHIGHO2_02_FULL_48_10b]|nr:MAG: hypothetical protein A3J67_03055 [Parcubacteria group bacterium RIFCSPHIGHO2_02_FULL_48_10b]